MSKIVTPASYDVYDSSPCLARWVVSCLVHVLSLFLLLWASGYFLHNQGLVLPFISLRWKKKFNSRPPHFHDCNVHIPEQGSLEMRLGNSYRHWGLISRWLSIISWCMHVNAFRFFGVVATRTPFKPENSWVTALRMLNVVWHRSWSPQRAGRSKKFQAWLNWFKPLHTTSQKI